MNRRQIISLTLLLAGLASIAVCNLGIERHAIAPVPLSQLGLIVDHSQQAQPIAAQMPTFFVVGAEGEDNSRKNIRLWDWVKVANGGEHTPNYPQQTGDCVSFGAKNACEYFLGAAIGKGLLNSEFHPIYPPYIYGGSRVIVGKGRLGRSAGSVGAWAAEWVANQGGVLRANVDGVPAYSGKVADEWGYKGPPKNLIEAAKEFTFSTVAPVRSARDVRDAICNGYPVTIASDFGTTRIVVKDGRRVGLRNTKWYHQMCIVGYDGSSSQPWYYVLNSWGPTAHPSPLNGEPPGGFWIGESDVEYIVRQGDSFAFSGFDGFPAQEFIPDFTVIGAAGPTPQVNASESRAMFPLSPDVQLPGTVLGIALLVAAFLVAFRRGNGIGRWAVAPMLIAAIMPTIIAAQESPVDFGMLTAAASEERLAATTVRSEVIVNPMFSALVTAAEEPPPVDFSVLTESATEKPAKKATQYVEPAVRQPVPMAAVDVMRELKIDYPTREHNWTYPGGSREELISHLLTATKHRGKFTRFILDRMSTEEIRAIHSDDHEEVERPISVAVADRPQLQSFMTTLGYRLYEWSDGKNRNTPEPGICYCGDGCDCENCPGGVCPAVSAPKRAPVSQPVYRSTCPGGVCPVRQIQVKPKKRGLLSVFS